MTKLRYFFPLIVFLIISLFFWKGLSADPHKIPSALLNKPVPNFTYPTIDGDRFSSKEFRGHISVLNVFASWCPGCYAEQPYIMDIAHTGKAVMYGLNYKDYPEKAVKWLKANGNPYQAVISDPQGRLGINLGVYGVPETFLIDQRGIIRYKHVGEMNMNIWNDKFVPVINSLNAAK